MRSLSRTVALALGYLLAFHGASPAAGVDVDFQACQKQMETLLRLDLDCTVEMRPGADALTGIPQVLQALIPGMACKAPVKFRKAQIYNEWITDVRAKTPDLPISCSITAAGQADRFTASLRVECARTDGAWSCAPVLHDVRGLGILGRQLENYVNTNERIRSSLTKALARP